MMPQVNVLPSTPQHSMLSNPPTTQTGSNLLSQKESAGLFTIMVLNFWTDRSGQTVQTMIRLLLEEQSDQGLHCLLSH